MRQNFSIFDYLTNSSEYIKNLQALAQEREWPEEPSDEFLTGDFWEAYVEQVYKDGVKVGKAGYTVEDLLDYEEESSSFLYTDYSQSALTAYHS